MTMTCGCYRKSICPQRGKGHSGLTKVYRKFVKGPVKAYSPFQGALVPELGVLLLRRIPSFKCLEHCGSLEEVRTGAKGGKEIEDLNGGKFKELKDREYSSKVDNMHK